MYLDYVFVCLYIHTHANAKHLPSLHAMAVYMVMVWPMEPWQSLDQVLRIPTRKTPALDPNIGALIIRIGFWGQLYYTYKKEPPT